MSHPIDRLVAHAVRSRGSGSPVILSHGLGGSQEHWEPVAQALEGSACVTTFTLAGSPGADPAIFSPVSHSSVLGFAHDLIELVSQAGLRGATFVGHSTSGMAGAVAAAADPGIFSRLVLIGASPRYLDDPETGYRGGFDRPTVDALLDAIESDFPAWAASFSPPMMGVPEGTDLAERFREQLLRYDREVAHWSFRAVLTSDVRHLVHHVAQPTLLLATGEDPVAPWPVTEWLARELPHAQVVRIQTPGHFPHVTAPDQVIAALASFLQAA